MDAFQIVGAALVKERESQNEMYATSIKVLCPMIAELSSGNWLRASNSNPRLHVLPCTSISLSFTCSSFKSCMCFRGVWIVSFQSAINVFLGFLFVFFHFSFSKRVLSVRSVTTNKQSDTYYKQHQFRRRTERL